MKVLKVDKVGGVQDIMERSIKHVLKNSKALKVSISSSEFEEIKKEYYKATGVTMKYRKLYNIGDVKIIFSKRRDGTI